MGLGLLGRGIGVTKFLVESRAKVTVTDLKTKEELKAALKPLAKFRNITYRLGGHNLKDFNKQDLIIRAANVPIDSPYLKEAKKNKITITQDATLFAQLAGEGAQIIGITGTRGKSTVTHLLYEILKASGRRVWLGGNVRGTATLPLLKKVKPGDMVVMELDSWQLQSFGDAKISPSLAIFTSFMNDHQNYYKNNLERYFQDKANIFKHQTKDDILIVGRNNFGPESFKLVDEIKKLKPKSKLIVPSYKLSLPGKHREYNAALASAAAKVLGVSEAVIKRTVNNFKGLPGRLELIKSIRGIKYYNDTTATTPDAVMAAVHALKEYKGKIILIGGGADKELDFKRYSQIVPKYLKELVLFKGSATDKILVVLPAKFKKQAIVVGGMRDAFKCAISLAERGDIVLLSPGAASFGLFRNEFDRGDQFNKLVKAIKK
ncbi:MAG: UDP-N-acetylmuramoylalanine--D-glutamate ligase [Candidatus Vogelbacteria bacterium GWA1_51_14]|uniref:UDP-N-acetylmuramoylalanine--D-glutamate ligase n=1 Tax=Candidatus Vogelbacteria bacterium GWA1_51_14 TaxID=1802435 RepID=A0A1G2Q9M6_9BACT|nr:MAG: UDP-N-acetylmuramoylalanine--D-glutamate ligase [Candidatus Vogelbacteria bacterium GWA1_51_14]